MRKSDYMDQLRANDTKQGPLKIVKLPTRTQPFALSEVTPKTLIEMGLFNKSKVSNRGKNVDQLVLESLEFHDVNDEYEEARKMNLVTEMRIASSKNKSFMSMQTDSLPDSERKQSQRMPNDQNNVISFEHMRSPIVVKTSAEMDNSK